jgi:hypothetical protein
MVSVPYTGTRFLRKLLEANHCPPRQQIHTHARAEWHVWFEDKVLCPMRDPILHAIGVVNRGSELRLRDFDVLAGLANENTHFFCVGTENMAGEHFALESWLGRTLRIDWTPVGTHEDVTGLRAKYLETGEVPRPAWLDDIGDGARALLRRLGYQMEWLS